MENQEFDNHIEKIIKTAREEKNTLRQLRERLEEMGFQVHFRQLTARRGSLRTVTVINDWGQTVTRNV